MRPVPLAVGLFTRALGAPVCTPEWIMCANGKLERARFRVWRWRCPVCAGGWEDPGLIWRPLVVDSDGRVRCEASDCSLSAIGLEVAVLLDVERILSNLQPKEAAA